MGNELGRVRRLAGPLVLGIAMSHVSGLVDNMLASMLPEGQLSYLSYGKKVLDAIVLIGPWALVTVVYSRAADLHGAGRDGEMATLIRRAVRLLLYVSVPLTCMLAVLRVPLVACLFERGEFDIFSTQGTADALLLYACGLVTFSLEGLLVYCFYSLSDTRTPVATGIACAALDILLAIVLLPSCQYLAIVAALVVSKTIKIVILGCLLSRRGLRILGAGMPGFLAKVLLAGAACWLAIGVGQLAPWPAAVLRFLVPAGLGALAYLAASHALRMEECRAVVSMVTDKFRRAGNRGRHNRQ